MLDTFVNDKQKKKKKRKSYDLAFKPTIKRNKNFTQTVVLAKFIS